VDGRPLRGGISSSVHVVTLRHRSGTRQEVVVRRWVGDDVDRARRRVEREGRILTALAGTEIPAPALVATSDGTETDAMPALVMTRVPGEVYLAPRDPNGWLRQMAAILPRIHELDVAADPWEPAAVQPRPVPDGISPAVWTAAAAVLAQPPPPSTESVRRFVHTDYQHFNLLWHDGHLSGVVDWVSPSLGSPDLDVAHCRLNLAVLFTPDWSERFRLAYEAEAGRSVHPWFDLFRLTMFDSNWQQFIPVQVAGRATVDIAGMPSRVEEAIAAALRQI
jgi:aminoglycoside phosphotransferase (APT) family kinase protein